MSPILNLVAIILFFSCPVIIGLVIVITFRDDVKHQKISLRQLLGIDSPRVKIREVTYNGKTHYEAFDTLLFIKQKIAQTETLDEMDVIVKAYKEAYEREYKMSKNNGKKWLSDKDIFERRL